MKKHIGNIKYIAFVGLLSIASCVSDDLPGVGDLEDITGPTPFFNKTDITTSEFDCNKNELWVNYDFNFQGGSNLAVNGTQYKWEVYKDLIGGDPVDGLETIPARVPVLELLIRAARVANVPQLDSNGLPRVDAEGEVITSAVVVPDLEDDIADLEFKIPCESDAAKVAVMQQQIADLEVAIEEANAAFTNTQLENIASLEAERDLLVSEGASLEDQELIFRFPSIGTYAVGLTVTDNLGKSDFKSELITVNQAVPTVPIPEIGEPGFEDNTLFDGSGDGRDSWRAPSSANWGTVFQINSKSELGVLPEGKQAAKFPADGTRVGYQIIELTPGESYVLSYLTAFEENALGDLTVSIVKTDAATLAEAKTEAFTIASRTDNNIGRVDDVFKAHSLTFEAGENESAVILITNSGVESRVDSFSIIVK